MQGEEKGNGIKNSKDNDEVEAGEESDAAKAAKERLLRLAAEFDNYKKRSLKELENARATGKAELASGILHVIDEFELALESIDTKSETGRGVAMVFSNLLDIMRKSGLKETGAKGIFDPYRHEIVMARPSNEPEGTILEVVRKGYTLNGIMLRPASVIVSKGNTEEKVDKA